MSVWMCGSAIHSDPSAVEAELRRFGQERGRGFARLDMAQCPAGAWTQKAHYHERKDRPKEDDLYFAIKPHEGWTLLLWGNSSLIPDIVIYLSKTLNCEVITIDQVDSVGYEHFSVLQSGEVRRLFTIFDDVEENVGVDYGDFIAQARASGKMRLPVGITEDEYSYHAYYIFNRVVAPFNLWELFLDMGKMETDDITCVRLNYPDSGQRTMGGAGPYFWNHLVSGAAHQRGPLETSFTRRAEEGFAKLRDYVRSLVRSPRS
jgi:hypothetical protein